jgi:hypothetical protein
VFEDYLQDSYDFLSYAERFAKEADERNARRYYRAAVFYASGAMEAFVNYIADSFAQARNLSDHEIAFLNDKAILFSATKGIVERVEFHKLDDKIKVLMHRFSPGFDFMSIEWNKFMEFKKVRDSLVHPRQVDDETPVQTYKKAVREGLKAIIEIMNNLSQGLWGKPLRRQLLDLIPD